MKTKKEAAEVRAKIRKKIPAQKFDKNHEHICPACDSPNLRVTPETQASCGMTCKDCGHTYGLVF